MRKQMEEDRRYAEGIRVMGKGERWGVGGEAGYRRGETGGEL